MSHLWIKMSFVLKILEFKPTRLIFLTHQNHLFIISNIRINKPAKIINQ